MQTDNTSDNFFSTVLCENYKRSLGQSISQKDQWTVFVLYVDWLNAFMNGLYTPLVQSLIEVVTLRTGTPKLLSDLKASVPPETFALILGTAAHCSEIDDSEFIGETHPSAAIFSSLISLADPRTNPYDFFRAAKMGFETVSTIGQRMNPVHYRNGWHGTSTVGSFGAFASAAFLAGLSQNQFMNGLTIVANEISGIHGAFGTEIKPMNAGKAAKNGVFASQLAAKNINGKIDIFECPYGVFKMFGESQNRADIPIDALSTIHTKKYPSCHSTHCFIEAALLFPQDIVAGITSIEIFGSPYAINMCKILYPKNRPEAFFSISFVVSIALLHGDVSLDDFNPTYFENLEVKKLIKKTSLKEDPNFPEFQAVIRITTKSGEVVSKNLTIDRNQASLDKDFIFQRFQESCQKFGVPLRINMSAPIDSLNIWSTYLSEVPIG